MNGDEEFDRDAKRLVGCVLILIVLFWIGVLIFGIWAVNQFTN